MKKPQKTDTSLDQEKCMSSITVRFVGPGFRITWPDGKSELLAEEDALAKLTAEVYRLNEVQLLVDSEEQSVSEEQRLHVPCVSQ